MTLITILKKYNVPEDTIGTCAIQDLKPKHVAYLSNVKYLNQVTSDSGSYILVKPKHLDRISSISGNTYIESEDPLQAFLEIHNTVHKDVQSFSPGDYKPKLGKDCEIHSTVIFGENVVIGDRVKIHPYVVIGRNVEIGDDTIIFGNTAIYDRVRIGKRNIIDSNASIGGDGYRIIRNADGEIHRLIHTGGVVFGDDVEFGNSSCVDRGTFGDTILEKRVKIDNMVHIGHNVHVKENSQLAASSCIGGSTVIGQNCWIGIGATLSNGLMIGDDASVLINAVVVRDVPEGARIAGFYAMPNDAWRLVVMDNQKRFGTKVRKMERTKKSEE
jgi:UDP-3-O-[3-hydroxymyristoyl] glucosamine N-acyltransferase